MFVELELLRRRTVVDVSDELVSDPVGAPDRGDPDVSDVVVDMPIRILEYAVVQD